MDRHYEVLGISPEADGEEVRRAYRGLLKDHHPDQGGSRDRFLRIKRAYEQITGEVAPGEQIDGGALSYADIDRPDPTFDPDEASIEPGRGLTVHGDFLRVQLTGLVHDVTLASLVDGGGVNRDLSRTVAFFELQNASQQVVPWRGRERTSFIGDDGFMYEGSNVVAPPFEDLPGNWSVRDADILPGRALHAIVIAQEIPEDVTVEKVVYSQHVQDPIEGAIEDTERYLFEIKPRVRTVLDEVPFELS